MFPNVYNRLIMRIVGDFDNERMFPIALFLYPFCALYGRKGQPSAAGGQQSALRTEILCRPCEGKVPVRAEGMMKKGHRRCQKEWDLLLSAYNKHA